MKIWWLILLSQLLIDSAKTDIAGCYKYVDGSSNTKCSVCHLGYYKESETKCEKCDTNCKECSISFIFCTACFPEMTLNTTIRKCFPCPSNCQECTSPSTCSKCKPGYFIQQAVDNAPACGECQNSCKSCMSQEECVECLEGYEITINGNYKYCEKKTNVSIILLVISLVALAALATTLASIYIYRQRREALRKITLSRPHSSSFGYISDEDLDKIQSCAKSTTKPSSAKKQKPKPKPASTGTEVLTTIPQTGDAADGKDTTASTIDTTDVNSKHQPPKMNEETLLDPLLSNGEASSVPSLPQYNYPQV